MVLENKSHSENETELISPIPGTVLSIEKIQALQTQIALIEVQQREAMEKLKLDIEIERARQGQG